MTLISPLLLINPDNPNDPNCFNNSNKPNNPNDPNSFNNSNKPKAAITVIMLTALITVLLFISFTLSY